MEFYNNQDENEDEVFLSFLSFLSEIIEVFSEKEIVND